MKKQKEYGLKINEDDVKWLGAALSSYVNDSSTGKQHNEDYFRIQNQLHAIEEGLGSKVPAAGKRAKLDALKKKLGEEYYEDRGYVELNSHMYDDGDGGFELCLKRALTAGEVIAKLRKFPKDEPVLLCKEDEYCHGYFDKIEHFQGYDAYFDELDESRNLKEEYRGKGRVEIYPYADSYDFEDEDMKHTYTVKEFINELKTYPENAPIMFCFEHGEDSGKFGFIDSDRIEFVRNNWDEPEIPDEDEIYHEGDENYF